jgi:hypothetical protein
MIPRERWKRSNIPERKIQKPNRMMKVVRKTISVPEKTYVKNCTDTIQKETISQPLAPGGKHRVDRRSNFK